MRKIIYVSGTRADFGLLRGTLQRAAAAPALELAVCVTGMHLSAEYGDTADEIEQSGLRICGRIPVALDGTGAAMGRAIAQQLLGMIDVFERERPALVLVLGDRGEMLAAALAAIHLNIPVAHVHGGERSGTVDEPIRHAISKLAHYHFVATAVARRRLIRMGEQARHVFVTGAPGLDGLCTLVKRGRQELCRAQGLDPAKPLALVVFHPVLQEADDAGRQAQALLGVLSAARLQAMILMPNADAGGAAIRRALDEQRGRPAFRVLVHLPRHEYVEWMAAADVMIGNSSSGIIEAASFGLPVVNIGTRQRGRERGANVVDAAASAPAIRAGLRRALAMRRRGGKNIYGDGRAGERIVKLLQRLPLNAALLQKSNAY